MKISFVLSSLWLSGGNRALVEYGNRLAARGHSVALVIPKGAIDPELQAAIGPDLSIVEAKRGLEKPAVRKTGAIERLRLLLSLAAAAPRSDLLVATHTPTTLVTLLAGRLLGRGKTAWFYMDYPGMFTGRPAEGWLLRNALRWHRGAVVLSGHSRDELLSFRDGDVRFAGLGLSDYEIFTAAQGSAPDPVRGAQVMYLGDTRPRKGLADFVEAGRLVYERRPDVRLLIVLKGPAEVDVPVPHQILVRPDTGTLAACYAASGLFVSSSWHEGFGLPPLEAMACGAPVVLTDSGGVRDYARDGENCLVVPIRRPDALAEAMLRVLNDPALAARFRTAGPATAAEFTWKKAVDRLEAALRDFLA